MANSRGLILATLLAVSLPAWAAPATKPATKPAATTQQQTDKTRTNAGSITIGQRTIFKLTPANNLSAQKRAQGARAALVAAITPEAGSTIVKQVNLPDDVQTKTINGMPVVTLKGKTIVTVTPGDSKLSGISGPALADRWAQDLRDAIAGLNIDKRTAFQAVRDDIVVAQQDASANTAAQPASAADTQLATAVRNQMMQDQNLKNEKIEVTAQNGVVTLRGNVTNKQIEQRALDSARKVDGVDEVRSDLRIQGQ